MHSEQTFATSVPVSTVRKKEIISIRAISRSVLAYCFGMALVWPAQPLRAQSMRERGKVTISGSQLLRDGKPWIPHGFFQVAFAVPPAAFSREASFYQAAYEGYDPNEYLKMKSQGADSVRMQLAQNGADPDDKMFFDPAWLLKAVGAVHAAREAGLVVLLSIQDEKQTGVKQQAPLPNDATRRVWRELSLFFGRDRGVLFELYNEPNDLPKSDTHPDNDVPPTAEQWERWKNAMNKTIAVVRAFGAVNVVVADGLVHAQQLSGAPDLADPLNQVLYAAHPYVNGSQAFADYNQTAKAWNEKFGYFSINHPVIISEWSIGYFCDLKTPDSVVMFLRYLQDHEIGLEAGLWDFAAPGFNNLTHGYPAGVHFTSFLNASGTTCALNDPPADYGPGKTVESWYLTGMPPTSPQ